VRGALTKIMRLHPEKGSAGVITASAGNHGQGVAYAAAVFKIPATVYVPETANELKVEAIKRLGAKVVQAGRNYNDAYLEAMRHQEESGATFVHAFNDPDVIAGQGTIAVELLRDLEDFDTVLVPIGGGGLIGGISLYLKETRPKVRVIGVEPAGADGMHRSLQAGHVVTLDRVNTIADGLAASAPGKLTLELAQRYVDEVVIVQDTEAASRHPPDVRVGASPGGAFRCCRPGRAPLSLQPWPEREGGGDPFRGEHHRRGDDQGLEIALTVSAVCMYAGGTFRQQNGGG